MNQMKIIGFLILLLIFSATSFAQQIKLNDDVAFVDGEPYLHWEKRNMANEMSISGMNSDAEEIYMMYLNYSDPNEVSKSNPEGKVRWVEINFLTLNLKCEIANKTNKGLVKLLLENNIYVDGLLNAENAEKLVRKYGTKFSDNQRNGGVTIIINN